MLSKFTAVKVLAALSVAGVGTGAAAGELPDPLQDLASDAAAEVDVHIPAADDAELSPEERDAEKAAREADKAAREAEREAEKTAREAEKATREAEKAAEAESGEESEAGGAEHGPRPDNHGAVVSDCARNTKLQGRAKGQAIAALARGDVDTCDVGQGTAAADAKASAKEAREAEKEARKAAREERKAARAAQKANASP